jgi:hypothetical protein
MVISRWVVVSLAVVAAIPFGWELGVLAADLLLGPDFGVFPVLTIPVGVAAAITFAVAPWASPAARLTILAGGTVGMIALTGMLVR